MSCQLTKPSSAALQTALQEFLNKEYPPPFLPHPPEKCTAWRTRRIVAELNALKSVDSLTSFETELRGVLLSQEARCRTKMMTAALSAECALREREAIEREETAHRYQLTQAYYTKTSGQFEFLHLNLLEQLTRRDLRLSEHHNRLHLSYRKRVAQLFLDEANYRDALCAQDKCIREELRYRRVIEIGNDLQREIIRERRLSGHLRSVAYSRTVQEARREIELQEDRDRSAVERLYQLHIIMLLEGVKEDFSAAMQKDVALLSDAGREATRQATEVACASNLLHCVEQEAQLRLLVEDQEAAEFKTLAQSYLLGWRTVYKAITKDPDVVKVFRKIELLVRREIVDQERAAFGALILASRCCMSAYQRNRCERRALCQEYATGARALWAEENHAANLIFRLHHLWLKEASALKAITVLRTEEAGARRGLYGAEAQARLRHKMMYASASVLLNSAEAVQRTQADEARNFNLLRHRYVEHFHTYQTERLILEERTARAGVERAESTTAADLLLSLRYSLFHFRISDVSRPLLRVEESFRSLAEAEESRAWNTLSLQCCRLEARASRLQIKADEQSFRWHLLVAHLCGSEEIARQALCTVASKQLSSLHTTFLSTLEVGSDNATPKSDVADDRFDVDAYASLQLNANRDMPECAEQIWSEMYADWELAEGISVVSDESQKILLPSLPNPCAARCEEMLADAYLQRDLIHFTEHVEWRRIFRYAPERSSAKAARAWTLHSISMKQRPNQRAASVNMWDSNQLFDVSFSLSQQQVGGGVGEDSIAFYAPCASSAAAAVLPRCEDPGMIFFLILDEEDTVLSSASLVMEADREDLGCLCIPLDNAAGYLRLY
ncbi:hypothetical protein ABL78_6453 [Leptomonas seymouri]|uniref:Uncharacterized protein n=1 Tax=Leptomonas seymouri TaxID=5684 RepID=A0A0N1HVC9_LEPSE|nr:hypothetical protein ABL78_6453 [Leptomonas seymouri]|eukprot:KPI84490.1 hypothetical protein ABL78_6453 [Leptomonas seymouri]